MLNSINLSNLSDIKAGPLSDNNLLNFPYCIITLLLMNSITSLELHVFVALAIIRLDNYSTATIIDQFSRFVVSNGAREIDCM